MAKKIIAFVTDFDKSELSKAGNIEFADNFEKFKELLTGDIVPVISTDLYANDDALVHELYTVIKSSDKFFYSTIKEKEAKGGRTSLTDNEIRIRMLKNADTGCRPCFAIVGLARLE